MKLLASFCAPVLSCDAARDLERALFHGDEAKEWMAMKSAGSAIAESVLRDFEEIGGFPAVGRVLVLTGKGHNGGDSLIAAAEILRLYPVAKAEVVFAFGERALRPLARRAWRELVELGSARVSSATNLPAAIKAYDLCLDGVFGFQFRAPAEPRIADLIGRVNQLGVRLRAAIDLPSAGLFRADFTYATGSLKLPLLDSDCAGRVRYLDLGFFDANSGSQLPEVSNLILTPSILGPLRTLRPARCDKRSYGHVFLLGSSREFPGAIMMSVEAALRSGAGLVTAFVPESLAPSFAARLPEAIWVGWPETPSGSLALEGEHLLRERIDRADAIVIGPGIGRDPETLALVTSIAQAACLPMVLDADALQPDIVLAGNGPRVVTPHAGEFKRIAGEADLGSFARRPNLTVVLKGPVTRLCDGGPVYHSFFGGPVLARGGSGDHLAGMIGTQLAQQPGEPLAAAARAVVWHGYAADLLARAHGQVAVQTTQLLDFLGVALREAAY